MGEKVEKQFLPLQGIPLIVHTLRVFEQASSIHDVLLVVPKGRVPWVEKEVVEKHNIGKISTVVGGGVRRQDSVKNGLACIHGGVVAIHDGVRPLVTPELVDLAVREAEDCGAAILAVRVKETLKDVEDGAVRSTLLREGVWLAQTPQVFQYELIKKAYNRAYKDEYYSTDDCALVERLGHEVRIVEGSYRNIKLTTEEDLLLAKALLEAGGSK